MKKLLLSIGALMAFYATSQAQVIFLEDFDGVGGPTAGGPGTYTFPAGWTLANVDNGTPAAAVSYINDAWERREDFGGSVLTDSCAFSSSWTTPAGTANDWMTTPAIGPLPANVVLSWRAKAYDPSYPDGYEVRIMTTPPTGGTANLGNLVSASTVLFSTSAEATTWTIHSVPLNAYAGQTVYVSFRNNSTDKFVLVVDDVKLEVQAPFDAKLVSLDTVPEYTIIPKSQVYSMPTLATIKNNGVSALTNLALKLNVYDGSFTQIATITGTPLPTLAPGASAQLSAGSYTIPSIPDAYIFEYVATHSVADSNPANDTLYSSIVVDDSTYARDNGTVVGALGIGAGNGGFLGQSFNINTGGQSLSTATMYVTAGYAGTKLACVLWNMVGGIPSTIVAATDTLIYPDDSARVYTLPMHGGPYALAPGMYALTAVEFDSTLALGQTSAIFKPGTTWVDWPTSPITGWANNEDFGVSFSKPYVLRMNLNQDCSGFMASASSTVAATCGTCTDGSATATTTGGSGPYTYSWSNSAFGPTITNVAAGTYTVTITDATGCVKTASVTVTNSCTSFTATADSTVASCGTCADGTATATVINGTGSITYSWAPAGGTGAVATGLLPGTYTVTIMDGSGCSTTATTEVTFSTSIEENAVAANTSIYPNPGKDVFTVHIPEQFGNETQITVTNYLGQTVYSKTVNSFGTKQIDLSDLSSGKYTVRFTSAKYTVNKNFSVVK